MSLQRIIPFPAGTKHDELRIRKSGISTKEINSRTSKWAHSSSRRTTPRLHLTRITSVVSVPIWAFTESSFPLTMANRGRTYQAYDAVDKNLFDVELESDTHRLALIEMTNYHRRKDETKCRGTSKSCKVVAKTL
jgi:hypothetical protein